MALELYGDDSQGVIKLDPRTKMLLFLASGALSLGSFDDAVLAVYGALLCVLLGLCGRRVLALGAGAVFLTCLFLRFCIETQATGNEVVVMVCLSVVGIALFCFPVVVSLLMLVQTTRISQFLAAFQAMHLPPSVVIPVAVMFRFIPTVQDEWAGIRKAMAFRGIRVSLAGAARHPFQMAERVLVPLLFSSMAVMEELAAAALARGLDAGQGRTSYEEAKMGPLDYAVVAAFGLPVAFQLAAGLAGVGA